MKAEKSSLNELLREVSSCRVCEPHLPLGANPVVRAHRESKILIIGQAPGTRVHHSGIPWNDPSGDRLRDWLTIDKEAFYDERNIAIIPMGFCYPGKGKSGDLPPRKECAPLWHERLLTELPALSLTLLVGNYAQSAYLQPAQKNLTENVRTWQQYIPDIIPLPHPSPRNLFWFKRNPWFADEVLPYLQERVSEVLK